MATAFHPRRLSWGYLFTALSLAAAYCVVGDLSLGARALTPTVSPLWPAAGLGLAAGLAWNPETAALGVLLGAGAVAFSLKLPPAVVLAMAGANAVEVLAAAWALERSGLDGHSFHHPRDFSIYSALTASTTALASLAVMLALKSAGAVTAPTMGFIWLTRFLAHWTGMLTITPMVLLWRYHSKLTGHSGHLLEGVALAAAVAAVCWALFSGRTPLSAGHYPLSFLLLPLALWPAVRMGLRETATVLTAIAAAALWGTVGGHGPFASAPHDSAVTVLQGFLAVASLVSMTMASAVWRAKNDGIALEEARAQLQLITDTVPAYIGYADADLRYRWVNRGFEQWFGRSAADLKGMTIEESAGPDAYAAVAPHFQAALSGRGATFESEFVDAAGRRRWIEVSATPDRDAAGKVRGLVVMAVDMTQSKGIEKELRLAQTKLRALNAELEKRVEQRTARLRQVNDELESFCYSVAHDLRSPLRKMSGFSEAVLHDYAAKLDPKGTDYLHRIFDASRRMGRLIDEMLDLSMVTRAEARDERVDLSAAARAAFEDLRHAEPDRKVEVVVEEGLSARGDPQLLEAALRNLIENAWKFTRPKANARIEVGMTPQEPSPIFFVRDDGVGFDMAHASKLFGAFERLHSRAEFPGAGIGLATVSRVVRRHGGRVWAEGELGKGAVFYFTLHERPL